ncbi:MULTISPECIES: hypothetical protein [Marinomonas]|uniref:Uncharacterized protein n=1 Tax=Marinomonas alcarazii TaxID=491949 RepID=A0A318V6J5_9GAMM|nr:MULTISPECIES: hypothetical protein [Marinomonas]MCW8357055.1 hypothetical protein [Marinomonas pontica]PYF83108.1 hypothetical protein DFP75_102198 [Marinomonas alcarazii]
MSPQDVQSLAETLKIINEITASKPNEWLPVYAALGGAVAGAIASFFPTWIMEKRRDVNFSRQIENCLLAEIKALVEIIDHRGYLLAIEETVTYLRTQPEGVLCTLIVDVPPHYSRVYQDNCKNIGVIINGKASEIITFHQLIDAVVQDIKPDGAFSSGATLDTFEKMLKIFEEALSIGRSLTKTHNKSSQQDTSEAGASA